MKKIILIALTATVLTGCASTIDKVKQVWPRAHDPALVTGFVNLQITLDNAKCDNKQSIAQAGIHADWLNRYAEFRNDPQKVSTKAILENLEKAAKSEAAVCQRWLNLSNTRMKVIQQAWSGR